MNCKRCGSDRTHVINEVTTKGKDYSATKGICGWILMGPIGILCGACGEGKKTNNTNYWVCDNCGFKSKM